jgi:hypothetical protein
MCPIGEDDFRLEDYKLKLANLDAHSSRMWTRFNYFVTIEAGLAGAFAITNGQTLDQRITWVALVEVFISIVWWLVAARDRFLWRVFRRNVVQAAEHLIVAGQIQPLYTRRYLTGYVPVGELDPYAADLHRDAVHNPGPGAFWMRLGSLFGKKDTNFGVTVIPMMVPLALTLLWWTGFAVFLYFYEHAPAWVSVAVSAVLFAVILLALWHPWKKARVLVLPPDSEVANAVAGRYDINQQTETSSPEHIKASLAGYHHRIAVIDAERFAGDVASTVRSIREERPHVALYVVAERLDPPTKTALLEEGATKILTLRELRKELQIDREGRGP